MNNETPPIQIESGIPIPERGGGPRGGSAYPLKQLEVGQSFVATRNRNSIASSIYQAQHKLGRKFCIRKVEGGFRVWRTA